MVSLPLAQHTLVLANSLSHASTGTRAYAVAAEWPDGPVRAAKVPGGVVVTHDLELRMLDGHKCDASECMRRRNPMWSVGTILNGLLSFMTDTAQVAKAHWEQGGLALVQTL